MADNITTPAAGTVFATDDLGGVHHPLTKLEFGANGSATPVSSDTPLPVTLPTAAVLTVKAETLPAGTNRSGTITTGGTAQQLAAANSSRRALEGQNISNADLWINESGANAAVGVAGSYKIASGEGFSISTNRAISIIGATTGQAFTATEI